MFASATATASPAAFHLRRRGPQGGFGFSGLGNGLVPQIGGGGFLFEQSLVSLPVRPGEFRGDFHPFNVGGTSFQGRLGLENGLPRDSQVCLGIVQGRLNGSRIYLIKGLTGFDVGTLRK